MLRKNKSYLSFDFETTGLRPYAGHRPFSYAVCDAEGMASVYELPEQRRRLQALMDDTSIAKIGHNVKFEISMLVMDGYRIPEQTEWHDTMILYQLLHNLAPKGAFALDAIAWELGGWPRELDIEISRLGNLYNGYQNIPKVKMHPYQKADVERTMLIFLALYPKVKDNAGLHSEYLNEIELIKTTQKMEQRGIMLDMQGTDETIALCDREQQRALVDIKQLTGETYDLGKPAQVRKLLYSKFKLPIFAYTDQGLPSTDKDTLVLLREKSPHAVIDIIQRYRSFQKGGAIIRGYRALAGSDNIIHPNIKTNHDSTGRESCDSPNLQNVSKDDNLKNPYIVPARQCFRARPGMLLWDADEAQIELRLIVDKAKCVNMIRRMEAGEKLHIVAARTFFGGRFKSKAESKALYDAAKNAHFMMWYSGGNGGPTFAKALAMPALEADASARAYQRAFPEVRTFLPLGKKDTDATGYTVTAFGRPLEVPHDKHYAWFNYYIQGTAASIIKHAQNRISRQWKWDGGLILSVHDSIMFETPQEDFENAESAERKEMLALVRNAMTKFDQVSVPLDVEAKCGTGRWSKLEEVRI